MLESQIPVTDSGLGLARIKRPRQFDSDPHAVIPFPRIPMPAPLPYAFEDRTGRLTASDFDEIYDRLFLHVAQSPQETNGTTLMIYNMHRRATRHRDLLPLREEPSVILEFGAKNALGVITFLQPPARLSVPMNRYLRKINLFGR